MRGNDTLVTRFKICSLISRYQLLAPMLSCRPTVLVSTGMLLFSQSYVYEACFFLLQSAQYFMHCGLAYVGCMLFMFLVLLNCKYFSANGLSSLIVVYSNCWIALAQYKMFVFCRMMFESINSIHSKVLSYRIVCNFKTCAVAARLWSSMTQ